MYDKLTHGKSSKERIVSIETKDDKVEIFTEDANGVITSEVSKNYYWLLAPRVLDQSEWFQLKGDLYYKYGKKFSTRQDFYSAKKKYASQDTYSISDDKESHLINFGLTYYKGLAAKDVSILSFDIETTGLDPNDSKAKVLLISNTIRKNGKTEQKLFAYNDYGSQGDFIDAWCRWVRYVNPSIICGHNIYSFDLPYLHTIALQQGTSLYLGRDGTSIKFNTFDSKFRKDQTQDLHYKKCRVYGRELIDTMFLAIKYDIATKKYESYALKSIIKQEGLEIDNRVFYDASTIRHKYQLPEEWEKIKAYALHDADDALALYDLMSPSYFYLTQYVPKSYQSMIESASGSQVNSLMVRSYLQEGHSLPKTSEESEFTGAISYGNPGIYSNVFKIDVASLYPNIILQYEVYDKEKDPEGNFLKLVQIFTSERLKNKQLAKTSKYHDDLQSSQKIFINSAYGFLGAKGLLFNSPAKAAMVTKLGRTTLEKCIDWSKGRNFNIANVDTDSISFCKQDQSPFTPEEQKQILEEVNAMYPEKIKWEHDGIYDTVIVVKAKNYVLYQDGKIKYKGSALRAPTLESALQEFIKELINYILAKNTDYTELYYKYVREINNITDIKRWVTRKTISDKTMNSERANETKVKDALKDSEYVEGDRAYFFFKSDDTLCLMENFTGDYNKLKMLEKLHKTAVRFESILDVKTLFPNLKLKRNQQLLQEIVQK